MKIIKHLIDQLLKMQLRIAQLLINANRISQETQKALLYFILASSVTSAAWLFAVLSTSLLVLVLVFMLRQ